MGDQAKQSVAECTANAVWSQSRTNRSASNSSLLQVPSERYGSAAIKRRSSSGVKLNEILFEEESDIIKNCCQISSAVLGLMKSFSTTDICTLSDNSSQFAPLRQTSSEVMLFGGLTRFELPNLRRLDYTSRSCSTWVNLGDPILSSSQLPSPQAQPSKPVESPTITSVDFIKSVNKKVRQMYLRRRLRAIGRLVNGCQTNMNINCKPVSTFKTEELDTTCTLRAGVANKQPKESYPIIDFANLCFKTIDGQFSVTVKDIERDKGKPLSKYERNIMIFNWLQELNEDDSTPEPTESA